MKPNVTVSIRLDVPVAARLQQEAFKRNKSLHKLVQELVTNAVNGFDGAPADEGLVPDSVGEEVQGHVARW